MLKYFLFVINLVVCTVLSLQTSFSVEKNSLYINEWLISDGIKIHNPVFADSLNNKGEKFSTKDVLDFNHTEINELYPQNSSRIEWSNSTWTAFSSDNKNPIKLENRDSEIFYAVAYIKNDRWIKGTLKINSNSPFAVFLDKDKLGNNELKDDVASSENSLELLKGKHRILLKFYVSNEIAPEFKAVFEYDVKFSETSISYEINPKRGMEIHDVLDAKKINNIELSFDASYVLMQHSKNISPETSISDYEILEVSTYRKLPFLPVEGISAVSWLPASNRISYLKQEDKNNSLYLLNIETGETTKLLDRIENLSSYKWAENESVLIYIKTYKPDKNESKLNRLVELEDRHPWWRNRNYLYALDLTTNISKQLTWGYLSTNLHDISPDGRSVLFSTERPQYEKRQYSYQNMYIMDITDMSVTALWEDKTFAVSAQFSPDAKNLLLTGGPSAFGEIGENIPTGRIANNYDMQAYIYNIENKEVKPITKYFDPSIVSAHWSKADGNIYFNAQDKTFNKLFKYDINSETYSEIDTKYDIASAFSFAKTRAYSAFIGESMQKPKEGVLLDLETNSSRVISSPSKEQFENVTFGKTSNYDFVNNSNDTIMGRVYYPPDFDKSKKYPLIVYYYGGTSPVTRTFGGRYPFNIFAEQGYVVYVLQPSGATGFGQEFSSRHVNNWGITVADEIINGTKDFLKKNKFCDPAKVGCIGASYGGFMTMLLQTRTDIFSAAISHAGISSIASYWGEGYWGYLYSSEASANNFPWNNIDLYIEQSPLFNADKVNTPILLLHGDSDTNVPLGESIQFFTALKLLGKPVDLVTIKDTDHHVIGYNERIQWNNAIFAWFDRWLKNQPEWWESMFPKQNY